MESAAEAGVITANAILNKAVGARDARVPQAPVFINSKTLWLLRPLVSLDRWLVNRSVRHLSTFVYGSSLSLVLLYFGLLCGVVVTLIGGVVWLL